MRGSAARLPYLRVVVRVSNTISQASLTPKPTTAACGAPPGATEACTARRCLRTNATRSARVTGLAVARRALVRRAGQPERRQRFLQRSRRPDRERRLARVGDQHHWPDAAAQTVRDLDDQVGPALVK